MPAWLASALSWLWKNRRQVAEVAEDAANVVHPQEPSHPLPYSELEHQRKQIDSATSHKVP